MLIAWAMVLPPLVRVLVVLGLDSLPLVGLPPESLAYQQVYCHQTAVPLVTMPPLVYPL
jgi:hypothetical protein